MEAVLTEAVGLLDEAGEAALTFRALAARLGGGVASIYWYVQNKDELLDRAADHVMATVLADTEKFVTLDDPLEALRSIGVALYDAAIQRPWLGSYFLRNTGFQPNSLRLYERIGGQVMRLHLTPRQTFHATSAMVGFVVGLAADMGQELPEEVLSGKLNRDQYMQRVTSQWRALDPTQYPYLNTILDEFEHHEDAEQFRAGLDLLLDGLRRQAEMGHSERGEPDDSSRGCKTRSRTNIEIDDYYVRTVMDRYGIHTRTEAVDLALRHLAGQPMTRDEASDMRGAHALDGLPAETGPAETGPAA